MAKTLNSQRQLRCLRAAFLIGGSAAILLTFTLWISLFLRPSLVARQQFHQELLRVVELRDRKSQITNQLVKAREEASHWGFLEELLQRRCSTSFNDAEFLEWLNRQAENCGVVIRDFRPSNRQQRDSYQVRGVSLTAQGGYDAICKLLDQMRNCPKMFRITGVDLTVRDSEGNSMNLSLQGELLTSSLRQPVSSSHEG